MRVVVCVLALLAAAMAFHYEVEDGVYIATDESFQNLLDTTEYILAEFCLLPFPLDRLISLQMPHGAATASS